MDLIKKTHSIFNDYTIQDEILGFGLNGKVLVCIDNVTNEKYALKTLKNKPKSKIEIDLQLRACKSCPYVAKIKDVYENLIHGKMMLLVVMELMAGGQLFDEIAKRTEAFTEKEVAKLMNEICLAVKHLHDMNIAHRDLKPENLLFSTNNDDKVIKLIDFGFAKETHLGLQTPCYTPYYVAPEILKSEKYDKSCDIWSLGVIMYILCCGYPPFYSIHGKPISPGMKKRIRNGDFTYPDKEWSKVSLEAKKLIEGMLDTTPEKRLNVDDIINSAWMKKYLAIESNCITALSSIEVMKEESSEWDNAIGLINTALSEMRIDAPIPINMNINNNKLYKKRLSSTFQNNFPTNLQTINSSSVNEQLSVGNN